MVKNPPAKIRDTGDASSIPGFRKDPLQEEMATHSSVLAWKIPWLEAPGESLSMGSQRVRQDWAHA